jgi:signal transduction histidine kinase
MDYSEKTKEELIELLTEKDKRIALIIFDQQESAKLLIRRDLALSRANEKLRVLDVAKSEFISIAAHQLRTPLSAIKWILSMVLKKEFKTEGETTEFLQKAAESCQRLILLVNDLLEVDHIQSGKDRFVFRPVDIAQVIDALVSESKEQSHAKGQSLDITCADKSIVLGDEMKLRALLQNLIENAIKYTPDNGKIQIKTELGEKCVHITITDTGIGIPAEQKSRLFTKFFRAQNAIKSSTVGSGLGLFIAKQIIERHGGTITFESEVGKGTTFYINLPRQFNS